MLTLKRQQGLIKMAKKTEENISGNEILEPIEDVVSLMLTHPIRYSASRQLKTGCLKK